MILSRLFILHEIIENFRQCDYLDVDVKKHLEQLPSGLKLTECHQRDEWECFCSRPSTCSGPNGSLSALTVIMGTLKEQELRLVTNLTKLRPVSSMTQQGQALRL